MPRTRVPRSPARERVLAYLGEHGPSSHSDLYFGLRGNPSDAIIREIVTEMLVAGDIGRREEFREYTWGPDGQERFARQKTAVYFLIPRPAEKPGMRTRSKRGG